MIEFSCVRPNRSAAELIYKWRQDPVTEAMSYHPAPPSFDEFYEIFLVRYFASNALPSLFITVDDALAGVLRFVQAADIQRKGRFCLEISIDIAAEMRGKGIGSKALLEIEPLALKHGVDLFLAEVKEENAASHALFLKAGYEMLETTYKEFEGSDKKIPIRRYLKVLNESSLWDLTKVFVIAEAGSNWRLGSKQRDFEMAKQLIQVASDAGVDAVKFQVYTPEKIYVPNAGVSHYLKDGNIDTPVEDLFKDLAMPHEMIEKLAKLADDLGIEFMATPFSINDFNAVDPYVKRHKIASYEIGHIELLKAAAKSGKPTLLSTGAATPAEIAFAVDYYKKMGGKNLSLMQCTASYPADKECMQLLAMNWLKEVFKLPIGLSDHSKDPFLAPISAAALGAVAIEKHFTLSRKLPGPDHPFALEPNELKEMVLAIRSAKQMMGNGIKQVQPCEEELREFAVRGIQALKTIEIGEEFLQNINIDILRPGNCKKGALPRYLDEIVGKKSKRKIEPGQGVFLSDVEGKEDAYCF